MSRSRRDEQFTRFVAAGSAPLVHYAYLLCGDAGLAEDLVQSALEKVYLRWHRDEVKSPAAYTRRVVLNEHLSRQRRRPWREEATDAPDLSGGSVPDVAEAVIDRQSVLLAMGALTQRERTVLVLRYHSDLTEPAVADLLGLSVGTIKSTASRAMAKLRLSPHLVDTEKRRMT